jgi:prepilin-type N-terminal cleavage/methylation domain-containing protein
MNLKRTKKGFTIVELVIVVGVIGILSAILIPTFVNLTEQAKERANQIEARDAYTAYVAAALDEVLTHDEFDDIAEDATVSIAYKKQEEVLLTYGTSKYYVWKTDKWVAASEAEKTARNHNVADTAAHSTFNKWVVTY